MEANEQVAKAFTGNDFNLTKIKPTVITTNNKKVSKDDNEGQYGILLASFADATGSNASNVNDMIKELSDDFKDGKLDDNSPNSAIKKMKEALENDKIKNKMDDETKDKIKTALNNPKEINIEKISDSNNQNNNNQNNNNQNNNNQSNNNQNNNNQSNNQNNNNQSNNNQNNNNQNNNNQNNDDDEDKPKIDTIDTPSDDNTSVEVDTNFIFKFDKDIVGQGSKKFYIIDDTDDTNNQEYEANSAQVTIDSKKVTIDPNGKLCLGHSYHIKIDAGAFKKADKTNDEYDGTTTWNFTTKSVGQCGCADLDQY
jgi:CCR4-NOT transcription complex subunit 7/8